RVGVQDLVGTLDDGLQRRLAHPPVIALRDHPEVDVHPAQEAALPRDVQDVARLRVDRALDAPVREVGVDQDVHHAPGVHRDAADVVAADRVAHPAARAVAADDILRGDDTLVADVVGVGATHGDADGILNRKSTRLNSSHVKISYAV